MRLQFIIQIHENIIYCKNMKPETQDLNLQFGDLKYKYVIESK